MKRATILEAIMQNDPEIIIDEVMHEINEAGNVANVWSLTISSITMMLINKVINGEPNAAALQAYLQVQIERAIDITFEADEVTI